MSTAVSGSIGKTIVAIPVDGRPVVREQVVALVATAGWKLCVPPLAALGDFRTPADRDALVSWLLANAEQASGFVLSLDMLVYGGLVPSRFIDDPVEALIPRLNILRELKSRFPDKPLYAFAATMRISNNNVSEEEKTYWALYGEAIWRWSFFADKFAIEGEPEDSVRANAAMHSIPAEIRNDYQATRARNLTVVEAAITLLGEGVLDRLILPQDDTAAYGFNIAERRHLQARIAAEGLQARAKVYPGADEVIHTLAAHLVQWLRGDPSLHFCVAYSDPANIESLSARYEDRPVLQSLRAQVDAVGGEIVDDPLNGDVLLAVHTQGREQGDWAMCAPLPMAVGLDPAWLAALGRAHDRATPIALLDLAYANGGDPAMVSALAALLPLHLLAAYAGWNTASNSIGGALAQCVLARDRFDSDDNHAVTCLRFLEDLVYQADVRQTVRKQCVESEHSPAELCARVAAAFTPRANAWAAAHGFDYRVGIVTLPWKRMFEIGVQLQPVSTV